ncbi:LPS export ABC transporter permease LptF [Desulfuromonas sp. AOP6]|uniref:LPS export ABC transporter permease LptF n=1 Tax=Desulfuromonas sp. AOP6 TaxID=1566351 RepID=UPI0012854B51|nr:LPS export ABC transporter permease LptF [Desulfuromonas sp. AOP6]BCA79566.1 LPS export ABC transporter permease LptG [Desulfuromonas sp. AOP6]
MPASRIHRYIAREIATPALLGLSVFTLMILMGRIIRLVEMVLNKGVPAKEIFLLFAFLLPAFLVITIPLSFLLGVLLGFGRLSSESETIALKASGISLYGMLKPVFLLAALASLLTGTLTLYGEPAGNAAFRSKVFEIAASKATVGIAPKVFNDDFDGLVLYTNEFDEQSGVMKGVFISDQRTDEEGSTIFAERGRIFSDPGNYTLTLRLEDGNIHRRPKSSQGNSYQTIGFSTYDISLSMGKEMEAGQTVKKKDKDFSFSELSTAIREAKNEEELLRYRVQWHKRLVLPLAPLLFALIGIPLGIQSHRSGKGGGFAIGLIVFLVYYILFSFTKTLATEGIFPVIPTMWAPTILFFAGGLHLLHLAAMERRFILLDLLLEGMDRFRRLIQRRR